MTGIVALLLLIDIEEDDDGGHEVNHLPGRQQVKIGAAIASSISVTDTILQDFYQFNHALKESQLIETHRVNSISFAFFFNKKKDTPIQFSVWTTAPYSSWIMCTSP